MRTTFVWEGGEVSGAWHGSEGRASVGLVLAHGAGYNMNSRFLIQIAEGLAARGIAVVRFNFPYAEAAQTVQLLACSADR